MDTLTIDDIDIAYRVGRRGTQPRPILVKFPHESIRNEINKKRFLLKEVDATKSAYLNADLPAKLSQQRLELRSIVNLAKSKQIDKQVYRHNDLHKLPSGTRLSDAFQVNTPKGIAFSGQNVPFSNFYPVKIVYNGSEFNSAEHAYQHKRAVFVGDTKSAHDIKSVRTPQEAKRIGAKLPLSKEWDVVKVTKMTEIVYTKFGQNPLLPDYLLCTGNANLVEATHDKFWGCGCTIRAQKLRDSQWQARNQLGAILVSCREEIHKHLQLLNDPQQPMAVPQPVNQSQRNAPVYYTISPAPH